jgi:hypothetical protein
LDFINGKRWDGDKSNRSVENVVLYQLEGAIGGLVSDKVPGDIILKAYQAASLSADLLRGIEES